MRAKIKKILRILIKAYGRPSPLRRSEPVGELIRTILSQNTSDNNSLKAFARLQKDFKSWDKLARSDIKRIYRSIKEAGLANIKAGRIKGILNEIKRREGRISLAPLKNLSVEDSLEYLKSLKGVGPKTAACVLLFSFGKPVMPVDTHIYRVAKRLGIIDIDSRIEDAHDLLSGLVPKGLIYDFHLVIIEHGRRTCRAQNPKCGSCVLYNLCKFEKKMIFKKRGLN